MEESTAVKQEFIQTKLFRLDDDQVLLFCPDFVLGGLKNDQAEAIAEDLAQGTVSVDDLAQAFGSKPKILAVQTSSITGMYTDVEQGDKLEIAFAHPQTGEGARHKLSFNDAEEKKRFIEEMYSCHEAHFTYDIRTNSRLYSIKAPLIAVLYTLVFGGGFTWLSYYMNTAESYSFRVPAKLYFVVLIIEYIGYIPVAAVTGIILAFMLIRLMKNLFVPTHRIVMERKKAFM